MDGLGDLVNAVRQRERDFHRESFLAGKIEVYEILMAQLDHFAKEEMKTAQG